MKRLLQASTLLFVLTLGCFAQPETFDLATFTPPAGWKKEKKDGVIMFVTSDKEKGTFCILSVYRSGESTGNARRDFDKDWQELILGQVGPAEKPEIQTGRTPGGWETVTGGAELKSDAGPAIALLSTFSGFGRAISFSSIFNDPDYLKNIQSFIHSMTLLRPTVNASPLPASAPSDISIIGIWGISSSSQSSFEVNHGFAGYITKQYTFLPDDTYEFVQKTFQYTMTNLLFKKETGTYQFKGNSLTLIPKKGYLQAWTKGIVIEASGKRSETDNSG